MANIDELRLDLEELKTLIEKATRNSVKDIIKNNIQTLEKQISTQEAAQRREAALKAAGDAPRKVNKLVKQITVYAWDQSPKFMKIYVTLNGVDKIPAENVTCEFGERSCKLTVKDFEGSDHVCHVAPLGEDIVPSESKHKVKTDMVSILLKKKEQDKTWPYVTVKDAPKKKPEPKAPVDEAAAADPQAGLMEMLKQMYEDGDDEMKKTISKAWSESQVKGTGAGPSE